MSDKTDPRWGVVATVSEPAPLLVAFVAHHLDLGAARIHLYLDRPNPELRDMIGSDTRVIITDATESFFRREMQWHKPKRINRRQIVLANHALDVTDADWLIHLDADEFVSRGNPTSALAALPDTIVGLRIPNGERVFVEGSPVSSIFDGPIALPINRARALRRLRGATVTQFTATGLLAHSLGKSALRARHGAIAGIHWPRTDQARVQSCETLGIDHFDGLTRLHWAVKMKRHIDNGILKNRAYGTGSLRHKQLAHIRDHGDAIEDLLAFHDQLRLLSAEAAVRMRRRGWLVESGVDASASIARQFPGLDIDLSADRFDAYLAGDPALGAQTLDLQTTTEKGPPKG